MTYREWWYKTAPIDILYELINNNEHICMRRFLAVEYIPEKCDYDCHKCMERLLNEERPTQSKHTS